MGHNSRSFWYQVYASHFCKGLGPRRLSGRICWMSWRNRCGAAWHGWKISWPNLRTMSFTLESVCRWSSKPAGIRSGASSGISWKDHHWKILEVGFLGYKQRNRIWNFIDWNGDGPENGWKDSGNVLRFKTGRRPSKRGIGSTRYKNAGIFEPS